MLIVFFSAFRGSWRIGNEVLVFTKKNDLLSIIFISEEFHTNENIEEVSSYMCYLRVLSCF